LALTVTATTPAANTVGVIVGSNVTGTFSETVAGVSGTTFTLRQGTTDTGALVPAVVTFNAATNVATLNPSGNLLSGTVYTARLLPGITSVVGAVPLTPATWSFTTAGNAPPVVIAQSPAPGATGVAVAANTTATFSVPVNGVSAATFTLRQGTTATGALVARAVTFNAATNVATLNPSANLLPGTVYTARLLPGITSTTGGSALAPVTWSFTTLATANPPPTVVATQPAAGATGASRIANITATFSEAVNGVTFTRFEMRQGTSPTGTLVPRGVTYNAATLTVTMNPTPTLLANTLYTVRLLTGITDTGGAPLGAVTWSFTTGP
jgi:methionine-rich copper-binding protein CopC